MRYNGSMRGIAVSLVVLAGHALAGGDGAVQEPSAVVAEVGLDFDISIEKIEVVIEGPVCGRFDPSAEDVEYFLRHATKIEGWRMEKEYPWFGCWAEGSLGAKAGRYKWQMTPAGTGHLKVGENVLYLVCDSECRELFPDGGSMFDDEAVAGDPT